LTKKTKFTRYNHPEKFIAQARQRTQHVPHSVAMLVLSPIGNQIAIASSGNAVRNGESYFQSPPQLRMTSSQINNVSKFAPEDAHKTVQGTALVIATEFLNMTEIVGYNNHHFAMLQGKNAMKHNKLWYVGTTRGNEYRNGQLFRYGKFVHWVIMRSDRYKDVFRTNSVWYQEPQWVSVKRLASLPQSELMSQRKFEMIDQALLMYGRVTGDYNKMVDAATKRQKMSLQIAA